MPDSSSQEIRVGDKIIHVEEPDGWKFLEATRLIGEITEEVPDLMKRNRAHIDEHKQMTAVSMHRDEIRLNYPDTTLAAQDDEWWGQRDNRVTMPGPAPSQAEQIMVLFNHCYKLAKDRVVRLIAILSAPSGELAQQDLAGNLEDYLTKWGIELLHSVKVSKLVLLLWRSIQAMQAEFAAGGDAADAVGEIRAFFERGTREQNAPSESESEPTSSGSEPPASTDSPTKEPPATASEPPKPASSSSSAPSSAGAGKTPSTDPAGASSPSSAASSAAAT